MRAGTLGGVGGRWLQRIQGLSGRMGDGVRFIRLGLGKPCGDGEVESFAGVGLESWGDVTELLALVRRGRVQRRRGGCFRERSGIVDAAGVRGSGGRIRLRLLPNPRGSVRLGWRRRELGVRCIWLGACRSLFFRRGLFGVGRGGRDGRRACTNWSSPDRASQSERRSLFGASILSPRRRRGRRRRAHCVGRPGSRRAANEPGRGRVHWRSGMCLGGRLRRLRAAGASGHHPVDERLAGGIQFHEAHRHAGAPSHRVHLGLHDDAFAAKQPCPVREDELEREPGAFGLHGARGDEHAAARHVRAVLVDELLLRRVREADAKREEVGRGPAHFRGIRASPPEP